MSNNISTPFDYNNPAEINYFIMIGFNNLCFIAYCLCLFNRLFIENSYSIFAHYEIFILKLFLYWKGLGVSESFIKLLLQNYNNNKNDKKEGNNHIQQNQNLMIFYKKYNYINGVNIGILMLYRLFNVVFLDNNNKYLYLINAENFIEKILLIFFIISELVILFFSLKYIITINQKNNPKKNNIELFFKYFMINIITIIGIKIIPFLSIYFFQTV